MKSPDQKQYAEIKNSISSSDGTCLQFRDRQTYEAYKRECKALDDKYYAIQRIRYGIWCGNQNKFVASCSEMNAWDGYAMENRWRTNQKNQFRVYTGYIVCHDVTFKEVEAIPVWNSSTRLEVESYMENIHANGRHAETVSLLRTAYPGCTISVRVV